MARMTAAQAAVEILKAEGVTHVFGLPGAAINPFYKAMKTNGGLQHVLARHVEGASHMAEGYTRTTAGKIGVCIGTSGPPGTDRIPGPGAARAGGRAQDDRAGPRVRRLAPDPLHHRPGARRPAAQGGLPGRRHRLDR